MGGTDESLFFVCPKSEEPYVYDPSGPGIPDPPGQVVVYDSAPVHSGLRWAIVVVKPEGGKPLMTRIVGLAEEKWRQLKAAAVR